MPSRVPLLSVAEIALAELCALSLWEGVDYETGDESAPSDEQLMLWFAAPVYAKRMGSSRGHLFRVKSMRALMRRAKLTNVYRNVHRVNLRKGRAAFAATAYAVYQQWLQRKPVQRQRCDSGTKAIQSWNRFFVGDQRRKGAAKSHRIAMTSRILFFATPDMMVFNFANDLAGKLELSDDPRRALAPYNRAMALGLKRNHIALAQLRTPRNSDLPTDLWRIVKKSDWWKRRVLDLALLLHYRIAVAAPRIQLKAVHHEAKLKRRIRTSKSRRRKKKALVKRGGSE